MNRAERRRIEKAKAKTHVFTRTEALQEDAFMKGLAEGKKIGSGLAIRVMTTAASAVLNHEYGLGRMRLEKFLEQLYYTILTIRDDYGREKRMRDWVKQRTGIDLDDYTGARILDTTDEANRMAKLGTWIYPDDKEDANGQRSRIEKALYEAFQENTASDRPLDGAPR